jgi:hypothetical protein
MQPTVGERRRHARRPGEAVMGKALSILAPETVDQPPPATCI